MSRFPHLAQLRLERERLEEEASAPVRLELGRTQSELHRTREAIAALERLAFSELGKHVLARIGADIGRDLHVAITKAVAAIRPRSRKRIATIRVPFDALRFSDPNSIESLVLEHWVDKAPAQLYISARMSPVAAREVVLSVTVPAITRGHIIAELP